MPSHRYTRGAAAKAGGRPERGVRRPIGFGAWRDFCFIVAQHCGDRPVTDG